MMRTIRVAGGTVKNRPVRFHSNPGLRPTTSLVKNAIFNIVSPYLINPITLDLFAGSGALGIEALSRGAAFLDAVEENSLNCKTIKSNLQELGFASISKVHQSRVEKKIPTLNGSYDLIIMDPPYSYPKTSEILENLAHSPILNTGGILVLEHSSPSEFPETLGNLCLIRCAKHGETSLTIYIKE